MPPTHFSELSLRRELVAALDDAGFTELTPIQAQALPALLDGADLVGHAPTGTGKTVAFGLALLQALDTSLHTPQALVMCPTRELADQVTGVLRELSRHMANTRVLSLCGGRPTRQQRASLSGGVHVVVGTPGRLAHHLRDGTLNLDDLQVLVLDEADRLLDMGFAETVDAIVEATPEFRRTLLFSATWPDAVASLSGTIQRDPVVTRARAEEVLITQVAHRCDPKQRFEAVATLIGAHQLRSALIFCETRMDCANMADHLYNHGIDALPLHGELDQRSRDEVLIQLSNGSATALVATNLAARGLDLDRLDGVIITEPGPKPDAHTHRIGRVGRAGRAGQAITLVATERDARNLVAIEEHLGIQIPRAPLPESAPAPEATHVTLCILGGRKDKLRPGDLLGALTRGGELDGSAVGQIDVRERRTYVAIERPNQDAAARVLRAGRIKGKRYRVVMVGGAEV